MTKYPDFLSSGDLAILAALNDPSVLTKQSPKIVAANLGMDRSHVNRRLLALVNYSVVERTDRGLYQITPLGSDLLKGNHDPERITYDRNE